MQKADTEDTPKPEINGTALAEEGAKWIQRIRNAEKREERWRKDAASAEKTFANDDKGDTGKLYDFNILHSNVETIVPAIYNSTPVPDVRRRWVEAIGEQPQDPTPQILQQAASQAGLSPEQAQQAAQTPQGQQLAQQVLQTPQAKQAILSYQTALKEWQAKQQRDHDAKDFGVMVERAITVQIDDNRLDKEVERCAQDSFLSGRGTVRLRLELDDDGEIVRDERITFEAVSWRDFRMGPGTRWETIPWISFRQTLPREALEAFSDQELVAAQLEPSTAVANDDDDDIVFWEIWSRDKRQVKFVREHDGKIIRIANDPFGLRDFFPMPEPVQPITLTGKMTPVCPFTIYQKLADELDLCTKRITAIMKGLKVRGLVVAGASQLQKVADADDNELVVADNIEGLGGLKSLEAAVLWWPIEKAITVLGQLYTQRDQIKAAIYEITGISDIVRGASKASETLGAQQIKTQWGALRIQKMQRMVARLVRDIFAIMAEIIPSKFSEPTLFQMTGIPVTDGMRALMQQPVLTSYRVDVESDSTVQADLTRQKGEMTQFLSGTAQYFSTMAGAIQQAPQMAEPAAEIYAAFTRVFRLGKQAEDAIEQMVQIAKGAAKQQKTNPEEDFRSKELALKLEDIKAKMGLEVERLKLDKQKAASDAERAEVEVRIKVAQLRIAEIDLALRERAQAADERHASAELAIEAFQQRPVAIGQPA